MSSTGSAPTAGAAEGAKAPGFAHRYVVVEGPIGVGKSTLARRLAAAHGADLVLEEPEANPFLERFYRDRRANAFPAQLFFLFQRSRQLERLRQQDLFAPVRIADFMFDKDRLFARLNLDDAEYALYEQVYERLALEAPVPDLVVYLQAPVEVLEERVARRAARFEHGLDRDYLKRVADTYAQYFHHYEAAPLLIVNAAAADFAGDDAAFAELEAAINRPRRGRHYLNLLGR